jgi:hypothetical protein
MAAITVTNPGFETGDLTGWSIIDGNFTVATTDPYGSGAPPAGTYGCWVLAPGDPTPILQQIIDLTGSYSTAFLDAGPTVTLGAQLRHTTGGDSDTANLRLVFMDGSNTPIGSSYNVSQTANAWALKTVSAVAPSGTRKIAIELHGTVAGGGSTSNAGFDSVTADIDFAVGWTTSYTPVGSAGNGPTYAVATTVRQWIDNALFSANGNRARVTFNAGASSAGLELSEVYIGKKGTGNHDFAGTPTQLLFGGAASTSVGISGSIVSDEVAFDIDTADDLVLSFYIDGSPTSQFRRHSSTTGQENVYKTGNDATTLVASGYSTSANSQATCVWLIEVATREAVSVSPTSGGPAGGEAVTITGTNLWGVTGVNFDGVPATSVVVVDNTTITCVTPAHAAGTVDVEIEHPTGDVTTAGIFLYSASTPPSFTSATPDNGPKSGGTVVSIVGDDFTSVTGVLFGGTPGTSFSVVDDEHITVTAPAHAAGLVDLTFQSPIDDVDEVDGFEFTPLARITQTPILFLSIPNQPVRVTQTPILVVNLPVQGTKITQNPLEVVNQPRPIPLPSPIVPDVPVVEQWKWLTIINWAKSGKEQRSALRAYPRLALNFNAVILNEVERAAVYEMLFKYGNRVFPFPWYQISSHLGAAASIGDTKLYFDPAATDMRAGEYLALFDPQLVKTTYHTIDTVDADGATLVDQLTFDVGSHFMVCPAPICRLIGNVGFSMASIAGDITVNLETVEPRVFTRPGSVAAVSTYDGMTLLDDRPFGDVGAEFEHNAVWFDNDVAPPDVYVPWAIPFISTKLSYYLERPADLDYWRAVATAMKGRQGAFLVPTFRNDLPLAFTPALSATSITTTNIQFFDFYQNKAYRYLRLVTANGAIYRRIGRVVCNYDANGDAESVTIFLNDPIGAVTGDNEISVVSYVNKCRLAEDAITLTHNDVSTVVSITVRTINE